MRFRIWSKLIAVCDTYLRVLCGLIIQEMQPVYEEDIVQDLYRRTSIC